MAKVLNNLKAKVTSRNTPEKPGDSKNEAYDRFRNPARDFYYSKTGRVVIEKAIREGEQVIKGPDGNYYHVVYANRRPKS